MGDIVITVLGQALCPPLYHGAGFFGTVHRQKAEIIYTVRHAGYLHLNVSAVYQMRAYNDGLCHKKFPQLGKIGIYAAVRVQIYKLLFRWICAVQPCLLYTSPSPRDRQKSRMPSSA